MKLWQLTQIHVLVTGPPQVTSVQFNALNYREALEFVHDGTFWPEAPTLHSTILLTEVSSAKPAESSLEDTEAQPQGSRNEADGVSHHGD